MTSHKILCELCDEPLVTALLSELGRPLTGEMFCPLGPGYDNPFQATQSWRYMLCPHCHNRPFAVTDEQATASTADQWDGPETVKTDKGVYWIGSKYFPGVSPSRDVVIPTEEDLEAEWNARVNAGLVATTVKINSPKYSATSTHRQKADKVSKKKRGGARGM